MKNVVISTDLSRSHNSTIHYALKLMRGQKCNFLILNLPEQDLSGKIDDREKSKTECLYYDGLQRLQKLQKDIDHYLPEEDFELRPLSIQELHEQISNISLLITGSPLFKDRRAKMLLDLFKKNYFPLLLVPHDREFILPQKVLMSLEPNLEIKHTTLAPFKKFFGNYKVDLELFKIYIDRSNPALEARDEFELAQLFEAYHPKIRKVYSPQFESIIKMNLEQKQVDLHLIPVSKPTVKMVLNSSGLQSSMAGTGVPILMIHGSEKHEPVPFTRPSRTRTKIASPS